MTYKRPCLPAPNDYNNGLCDYYGYGYGETRVLNSTIDLNFRDVVTSKLKKIGRQCTKSGSHAYKKTQAKR